MEAIEIALLRYIKNIIIFDILLMKF